MHDPDEPLLSELREYFARVDPVPPIVTQAAQAALGWRRLDAELAELLSDSALEVDSLAGVRGVGAPVRSVGFRAGGLTIELEIHADGTRRTLLGVLTPPSLVTVDVQAADGETVTTVRSDDLGRFRAVLPAAGKIRLRLGTDASGSAAPVETSWITV